MNATEPKTYNGWTNYETWNVNLWMTNDQQSSEYWDDRAQNAYDGADPQDSGGTFTKDEQAAIDLADWIKEEFEEDAAELLETAKQTASVWADLLGAALSEVNWYEIAENMIEEVDKTDDGEDDAE